MTSGRAAVGVPWDEATCFDRILHTREMSLVTHRRVHGLLFLYPVRCGGEIGMAWGHIGAIVHPPMPLRGNHRRIGVLLTLIGILHPSSAILLIAQVLKVSIAHFVDAHQSAELIAEIPLHLLSRVCVSGPKSSETKLSIQASESSNHTPGVEHVIIVHLVFVFAVRDRVLHPVIISMRGKNTRNVDMRHIAV